MEPRHYGGVFVLQKSRAAFAARLILYRIKTWDKRLSAVEILGIYAQNLCDCEKLNIRYRARIVLDSRDRATADINAEELELVGELLLADL